MNKRDIYCNICDKPMRQYNYRDKTHFFICDTDWCPMDSMEVKVHHKAVKQKDGSYLTVA